MWQRELQVCQDLQAGLHPVAPLPKPCKRKGWLTDGTQGRDQVPGGRRRKRPRFDFGARAEHRVDTASECAGSARRKPPTCRRAAALQSNTRDAQEGSAPARPGRAGRAGREGLRAADLAAPGPGRAAPRRHDRRARHRPPRPPPERRRHELPLRGGRPLPAHVGRRARRACRRGGDGRPHRRVPPPLLRPLRVRARARGVLRRRLAACEFSFFLELPVEAENSQPTNQPTNQPTTRPITHRQLPK